MDAGCYHQFGICNCRAESDAIKAYWDQRASLGETAGTQDLILKQLEERAILGEIDPAKFRPRQILENKWQRRGILEIGCGLGRLAGMVAERVREAEVWATDTSEAMIQGALDSGVCNVTFRTGDVFSLPSGVQFDLIYTERCLINLGSWAAQKGTIDAISARLTTGGKFIMCEHSADGLAAINTERARLGLPTLKAPWHNRYIFDHEIASVSSMDLVKCIPFSATYYFLSRVVNAALAAKEGREPAYDAEINQLALTLPYTAVDPRFAQGRLWVWGKE
jgi:SAM-dependent methyltransferase